MVSVLVPVVVFVIGLLVFFGAKNNPDVKEAARAMLWVGLFFSVAAVAKVALRL